MANKRFTDIKKWKNKWFRTLPIQAKVVWIYLCDEAENTGVWKADYELASFQVGFDFDEKDLMTWFGNKVHFFDQDKVLIVQFFEFQYGDSKDTWSAKIQAKSQLEALGFKIENNKVIIPQSPHCPPTVGVESMDSLSIGISKGKVEIEVKEVIEENLTFPSDPGFEKSPEMQLVEFWNAQDWNLPKVSLLTKKRKDKIKARLKEATLEEWKHAIELIHSRPFLLGREKTSTWMADFDWLIANEDNRLKIVEGKYKSVKPDPGDELAKARKRAQGETLRAAKAVQQDFEAERNRDFDTGLKHAGDLLSQLIEKQKAASS